MISRLRWLHRLEYKINMAYEGAIPLGIVLFMHTEPMRKTIYESFPHKKYVIKPINRLADEDPARE